MGVRFEADKSNREFDVVSDVFIGQHKSGNATMGSNFRNQAKSTFEAAKATNRVVWYEFQNKPSQDIIDKLNEYSVRYKVDVVINYPNK